MPQPSTEIMLGAARDVMRELSDVPLSCCRGGAAMIEWLDGLRGQLKTACAAAEEADRARSLPPQRPTGRRTVLLDRRAPRR